MINDQDHTSCDSCLTSSHYLFRHLTEEEKQESDRQRTLQRELEWIKMSPRGRQAKSKARITSYENMLKDEKDESRECFWRSETMH